jgi:hypothetical protein
MSDIKEAILISAFPGTGKSYLHKNSKLYVKDSDSSKFDKNDFPRNYIDHIKSHRYANADIICISSHENVRNALVENNLPFLLVYPDISLKDEYLEIYRSRGDSDDFINLISDNWDNWITQLMNQKHCIHVVLPTDQSISTIPIIRLLESNHNTYKNKIDTVNKNLMIFHNDIFGGEVGETLDVVAHNYAKTILEK